MARGVLIVESRPASPEDAAAYHDWYDNKHVPEICSWRASSPRGQTLKRGGRSSMALTRRAAACPPAAGDPAEISPYQAWRDVVHGAGCVVFECVGIPGVLDSIIKGCARGTRIFSVGGPPEGDLLHTLTAKPKGLNIQFGGGPSMTHRDEAFEAVCRCRADAGPERRARRGARCAGRLTRRQRAGPHRCRALIAVE